MSGLLLAVACASCAGASVGFLTGLVPGFHMNNIAALTVAYAGAVSAAFSVLGGLLGSPSAAVLVSCFVCAAMVGHMFSESVSSTYLGIPAEDTVSVLPAHRLAKAGLGPLAVNSSADGLLAGVVAGLCLLLPACMLMGGPVGFYDHLRSVMGAVTLVFSAFLVLGAGPLSLGTQARQRGFAGRVARSSAVFLASGVLGAVVLFTDFNACPVPDLPWVRHGFVNRSSLLLPLFAGLFGIPSLLLSLGSRTVADLGARGCGRVTVLGRPKDYLLALLGGTIVGWLPGMTAGSAVSMCVPAAGGPGWKEDIEGSARFIWLYSCVSAAGAVSAVGALFVIARARSGSMSAVACFLGPAGTDLSGQDGLVAMLAILLAMLLSACVSRCMIRWLNPRLADARHLLCSRGAGLASLLFICALSLALTGVRGALVMSCAACLGLIPPLAGARRICLMGCLLAPITVQFLT